MIKKIVKFLSSPDGDTMVITKEDAKELVMSYQGIEMGAMACEVLVYAIQNDIASDIKEYCDTLISDAQFMLDEYNKIFKERQDNPKTEAKSSETPVQLRNVD